VTTESASCPTPPAPDKLDKDLGIWIVGLTGSSAESASLAPPRRPPAVRPLVEQVTQAPYGKLSDQMMAEWFMEANMHHIHRAGPPPKQPPKLPGWWNKSISSMMTAR
jgi:hypothetical protein